MGIREKGEKGVSGDKGEKGVVGPIGPVSIKLVFMEQNERTTGRWIGIGAEAEGTITDIGEFMDVAYITCHDLTITMLYGAMMEPNNNGSVRYTVYYLPCIPRAVPPGGLYQNTLIALPSLILERLPGEPPATRLNAYCNNITFAPVIIPAGSLVALHVASIIPLGSWRSSATIC